jgi:3-hydroxyisobutyrate dehydrogenase
LSSARTLAFVGLGQMGRPMATLLARAGHRLRVYDANRQALEAFTVESAANACASAAEAARGAEVLITMLPDGRIVHDVLLGAGRAADALGRGATVVDMSSSDPVGTRELGTALAAKGIALVDAPVSGGVRKAVDGTLSIMAGGDAATIERVRPLLENMGSRIFLTGPLGSGHAMKALNNYVSAAGLAAAAEALVVGASFGLDPAAMTDILNASTGRNNTTEVKVKQFMLSGAFNSGFSVGLMAKDLATAAALADAVGVAAPFAHQCANLWKDAAQRLGANADHTEMYRYAKTE